MITVTSERLRLTSLTEEDFQDYWQLDRNPEVMKHLRKPPQTEAEARFFFDRYLRYMNAYPQLGIVSVRLKDTGEFIGLGVLVHLELNPIINDEKVEVGYRLHPQHWGKGYATEIAKTLISYGFNTLGLCEVFGATSLENLDSQKTLMKAGLSYVGDQPYYGGSKMFLIRKA